MKQETRDLLRELEGERRNKGCLVVEHITLPGKEIDETVKEVK